MESSTQEHSDMILNVSASDVEYWESYGDVKKMQIVSENEINIVLSMTGEGERWESTNNFKLTDNDHTLIISGSEAFISKRVRCQ